MANHKCEICGVDVNLLQQQKLADGSYICRKTCRAKGFKDMDYVNATLPQVQAHLEQVEYGTKLWHHYFVPRMKTKEKDKKLKIFDTRIYIAEDIGLMALVKRTYKFLVFGKTEYACVYRIADLYEYEYEPETKSTTDGKTETLHYIHFFFHNVEGLYDFRVKLFNILTCRSVNEYFNKLFGIEKTLGNIKDTWTTQVNAIKGVAAGIKAVAGGAGNAEQKAGDAIDALDTMKYGDRTQWIAKADAALDAFKG